MFVVCDSSSCTPCCCHMPSMRRTAPAVTQCASRTRKRRAPVSRRRLRGGAKSAKKRSKDARARRAKTLSYDERTFIEGLPEVPLTQKVKSITCGSLNFYDDYLKEANDALRANDFDKSINGRLTPWSYKQKTYAPLEVFIQAEKCIAKLGNLKTNYGNNKQYQKADKYFNYVNGSRWDGLRKKHAIQGCTRMNSPPWDSRGGIFL